MTSRNPDIDRVQSRLRSLRFRVRTLYALHGISRVALLMLFLVVATFFLDQYLVLPRSVRTLLFFGSVVVVLTDLLRRVAYPLRKRLTLEDMAATVERRFPELRDRLITAIELSRTIERDDFVDSRALAARSIEEALDAIESVRFQKTLAPGGVQRMVFAAVVGIALVTTYASMNPLYTSTWFRRMIALQDVSWPRQTFLEVILPREGQNIFSAREDGRDVVTIASGEDLLIRVQANGRVPRSVSITYDTAAGEDGSRDRETRILSKVGEDLFQYTFLGVTDSFDFFVRGGDDQSGKPVYRVRVLPPPRVDSVDLACTYPPYTGFPPATIAGGNLEAPVGTRITLTLKANLELENAFMMLEGSDATPLDRVDPQTFTGSMLVDQSRTFTFNLKATNGLKNTRPMRFTLRAVSDLPPSLQVYGVGGFDFDATVDAALPVRVISSDDYGVANVAIRANLGRDGTPTEIPLPASAHLPAERAVDDGDLDFPVDKKVLSVALIDLPQLKLEGVDAPLEPGDILYYRIEAQDTHTDPDGAPLPQSKETQPFRVHLVQRAELERKLNDWQVRLKTQIHKMVSSQESNRDELRELLALDTGESRLASSDAQAILDAEIAQNRITNESKQAGRDFRQIFNTYLYNRIENSPLTEKLIADLQTSARRFDVEELERYRELFARVPETERQKSDILGKQLTMLELMLEVGEATSPETTDYLTASRKTEDGGERKRLIAGAIERQDLILQTFETLLRKMQEWEDFQEVVQETKELIELQKSVRNRTLRELEAEKQKRGADDRQK